MMRFVEIPKKPKNKVIVSFTTNGKIAGHIDWSFEKNAYEFVPSFEAKLSVKEMTEILGRMIEMNKQDKEDK